MGVANHLAELVELVARMRAAQRNYFREKTSEHLRQAKQLEQDVDGCIAAYRRAAFAPDRSPVTGRPNTDRHLF